MPFRGTDADQKHAFEDALAKLGCSVPRYPRAPCAPDPAPDQTAQSAARRWYLQSIEKQ